MGTDPLETPRICATLTYVREEGWKPGENDTGGLKMASRVALGLQTDSREATVCARCGRRKDKLRWIARTG
ncbi:hypothetical protein M404DRAFT_994026 [Pisolithus tinctorius Marx 270]|uniref:Uncharacterized protein n=1 Tax=Pisolithus tinctorius Marx 270 TaxID=870435 RepID=A0A0C3PUY8_PISTI|nr:hypothetical protein M404DRAFT_994026 [Pisolithus tinctorius Marx 270]